ncbi:RHS repeat-associated core domain-containing protein, partial [Francisellaceae bacterium]|nr:RHS repeat-associated core domain-containing protein [Francisellaceae bacterium]
ELFNFELNPKIYGSGYYDSESNLQYMGARYYSADIQRFMAQDSYNLLNHYNYANGNPVMNYDPDGHLSLSKIAHQVEKYTVGDTFATHMGFAAGMVSSIGMGLAIGLGPADLPLSSLSFAMIEGGGSGFAASSVSLVLSKKKISTKQYFSDIIFATASGVVLGGISFKVGRLLRKSGPIDESSRAINSESRVVGQYESAEPVKGKTDLDAVESPVSQHSPSSLDSNSQRPEYVQISHKDVEVESVSVVEASDYPPGVQFPNQHLVIRVELKLPTNKRFRYSKGTDSDSLRDKLLPFLRKMNESIVPHEDFEVSKIPIESPSSSNSYIFRLEKKS